MTKPAWRHLGAVWSALAVLSCFSAVSILVLAQDGFAQHYIAGEQAYQDGDLAKAEQEFLASLKSKDVSKSRGASVLLVSQQRGFFPEYYLASIYCRQQRYDEMKTYSEAAKKYIKAPDPKRLELEFCDNASKKPRDPVERSISVDPVAPVAAALSGPMYALVIGINHYEDKAFKTLTTAESDAKAVSELLHNQYGFDTQLLLGDHATRRSIIQALDAYARKADETSSLLIYFGGHGTYDKNNQASWLPYDAEESFTSNWIKAAEITSEISGIPARHIIVISDSCYSGGLTRDVSTDVIEPDHVRYVQRVAKGVSRNLMSSGGKEPVSDGGGGADHSVFAGALLKGLTSTTATQFTGLELFRDYIEVSVAGRSQQTPQYVPIRDSGHDGGDFVFVRKNPK